LSSLAHPNICPVAVGEKIGDELFVLSPHINGFTLADYIPEQQGNLRVESLLLILQKAMVGLIAAHNKNIIHHNVFPGNIHIDSNWNLRLINFFPSRFFYKYCPLEHCRNEVFPLLYSSPEKLATREEGASGDVFSLGVAAYFLLTGKYPFQSSSKELEHSAPVPPNELRDEIPERIGETILEMLSFDPAARPTLPKIISVFCSSSASLDGDKISGAIWDMIVTDSDTKKIPKIGRLSPGGFEKDGNKKGTKLFFIKSLLEKKE
jgi:serine/threonine-protein kinase